MDYIVNGISVGKWDYIVNGISVGKWDYIVKGISGLYSEWD